MAQDGKDSAGVVLAVGNTVNLTGTVTSINLNDSHYNDILVTLTNPLTASVQGGPLKGTQGADITEPGMVKQITVHSSMLTKV